MTDADLLSADDLCRDASGLLQKHGLLDAQPDGRVTAAPDPRTIRYYTTLGLLDRPRIIDREARYGWRHILQLLAVKALQHAGQNLSEIQRRVYGLTEAELEDLLRALTSRNRLSPPRPVVWREVAVEPGVKILVEDSWAPSSGADELARKIRAALEALAPPGGYPT